MIEVVNVTHPMIEKYTGSAEPTGEPAFRCSLPEQVFCFALGLVSFRQINVSWSAWSVWLNNYNHCGFLNF